MTPVETAANVITIEAIERLTFMILRKPSANELEMAGTQFQAHLEMLESWLWESSNFFDSQIKTMFPLTEKLRVPTFHTFHEITVLLDVCHFTQALMDFIESNMSNLDYMDKKHLAATIARIRKLVAQCFTGAHNTAKKIQNTMKQAHTASEITKAGIGEEGDGEDFIGAELRQLVSVPWMKDFCAILQDSWDQALQGVVQLKAP